MGSSYIGCSKIKQKKKTTNYLYQISSTFLYKRNINIKNTVSNFMIKLVFIFGTMTA